MNKICPLTMIYEEAECIQDECNGYINGECFLNRISLSIFYAAKNLNIIAEEIEDTAGNIERMREGR